MGNETKALADANKSISLVSTDANAYETRAEIYEKLGQRDKAIADYRKSVALDPKQKLSRDALKRLGVAP
jgi:Flp pilus assembly protein TadD